MTQIRSFEKEPQRTAAESQEIDQVRRLLFGELQNANERRMENVEQRLDRLESAIAERFQHVSRQIATLGETTAAQQRASLAEIGKAIAGLGEQISQLALQTEPRPVDDNQTE